MRKAITITALFISISFVVFSKDFIKEREYTVLKLELQSVEKVRDNFFVAWIDASPVMPNISVKILPDGLKGNVKWDCKIHFYEKIRRKVSGSLKDFIVADSLFLVSQLFFLPHKLGIFPKSFQENF